MKLLISTIVLFSASLAIACPNLSGTFTCPADQYDPGSAPYTMTVSQSENNGITTYVTATQNGAESIVADGVAHESKEVQYDENNKAVGTNTMIETYSCAADALVMTFDFISESNSGDKMTVHADGDVKINAANNLESNFTVVQDGQTDVQQEICTRN